MQKFKINKLEVDGDIFDGFNIVDKIPVDILELNLEHDDEINLVSVCEKLQDNGFNILQPDFINIDWLSDYDAILQTHDGEPLFSLELL